MSANLKARTIADFGDRPTAYGENPSLCGDAETQAGVTRRLTPFSDVSGTKGADIDSESRRIVSMPAYAGITRVRTHHWHGHNCTVSAFARR